MKGYIGLSYLAWVGAEPVRAEAIAAKNQDAADFRQWISQSQLRTRDVAALDAFLKRHEVHGIVPTWQLLLTDSELRSPRCPVAAFAVPPRSSWPQILPTLRLIRGRIVPVIGQVRILSGHRPKTFNTCIGGAKGSAHLSFAAFDLEPIAKGPVEGVFKQLCSVWRVTPKAQGFGLGAYFDRKRPELSPNARFHVDTRGHRTWGFSKKRESSYCIAAASG
jgi:hypothetical protein